MKSRQKTEQAIMLNTGQLITKDNAPPWWEHWVPGGMEDAKLAKAAEDNAARNRFGNNLGNFLLWSIIGLIVVSVVWLVAVA